MPSAPAIDTVPAASRHAWLHEFFRGERGAWIFVFKSVFAIYLAAWLAMWLKLEQPSTTMITVAIVMHPHSGMVLAKSFYRAIGTLAGSVCGLALIAMFPQQRVLFLLSLSLWVGLCAGGAMLYRNFMSYGFVLAGYTAAIVTLPVISMPLHAFDSAVMRVSEVLLGIGVAALVSDLVFPERLRTVLRQSAREQFAHFIDFVRGSTGGSIPRQQMEQAHLAFVRAAVRLEDLRASVIFEDPEARARSSRMRLLNQHYMAASTSFHSLHHLINRLQRSGRATVADALIAGYRPIGAALTPEPALQHDPQALMSRLVTCLEALPAQLEILRAPLADRRAQLEFDTGAALLQRFTSELRDFTRAEHLLRGKQMFGSVDRVHFQRGNDRVGAAIAVLRTFLTMSVLSVFWLASGWTYGVSAMLLATIFSGLLAASPNPLGAAKNTFYAYAGGMTGAFVVAFVLLPGSEGYGMLIAASVGFLLIGPYLTTRTTLPGMGAAYTLGFVYILALKNPMVYDPTHFLNDAVAQLAGVALAGVAFVFIPRVTGSDAQRARQLRRLRELVTLVATAPMEGLGYRFESVSRDLFQQVVAHTPSGSAESRDLLGWGLAVQESGRAVLELRRVLVDEKLDRPVRNSVEAAVQAVADLYRRPDKARWSNADTRVLDAIYAAAGKQSVRMHLYQLRSALRDDESPLAVYMPPLEVAADAA